MQAAGGAVTCSGSLSSRRRGSGRQLAGGCVRGSPAGPRPPQPPQADPRPGRRGPPVRSAAPPPRPPGPGRGGGQGSFQSPPLMGTLAQTWPRRKMSWNLPCQGKVQLLCELGCPRPEAAHLGPVLSLHLPDHRWRPWRGQETGSKPSSYKQAARPGPELAFPDSTASTLLQMQAGPLPSPTEPGCLASKGGTSTVHDQG